MARYAVVRDSDNLVVNVVDANPNEWNPPNDHTAFASLTARVGDTRNPVTGVFTSPSQAVIDAAIVGSLRNEALRLELDTDSIPKLVRALALVTLDEINSIRAAATVALPARTATQLRNAIRNKISTGAADA